MTDTTQTKRRGRPPLAPADRKDGNLTFRTRGDLRQRLAEAAKENGRSISEEVEWRLERSFEGPSDEDRETVSYYQNIQHMMGTATDFIEMVELGLMWGRVKSGFKMMNATNEDWFYNRENVDLIERDFRGAIRRILLGFAGRRQREANAPEEATKAEGRAQ